MLPDVEAIASRTTSSVGEMLEERDQIGEGFMPCEHVRVGGLRKVPAEPVHERMGDFVGDDVRRQAGEDHLAGQIGAGILQIGAVVAEQHRLARRVEVGVAALERVRNEAQLLVATPPETSAEIALESFDNARCDRVDDLLVRAWIALGRLQAILGEHVRLVEIDHGVPALAHRVEVDDAQQLAFGPLLQVELVGHADGEVLARQPGGHRVEGVGAQASSPRRVDGRSGLRGGGLVISVARSDTATVWHR